MTITRYKLKQIFKKKLKKNIYLINYAFHTQIASLYQWGKLFYRLNQDAMIVTKAYGLDKGYDENQFFNTGCNETLYV